MFKFLSFSKNSSIDDGNVKTNPSSSVPELKTDDIGAIYFSIYYDHFDNVLTIRIIRAVKLPAKDFSGTSDPYVKISLLPDKRPVLKTNIKRKNLNPVWNETFSFEGYPYSKLMSRCLYLQVFDYDRFSRDDQIGEVCVPLASVDITSTICMWKKISQVKTADGMLGSIKLTLFYDPKAANINITIIECKNLRAKDITGFSDPYVKIWILYDNKRVCKYKTSIKKRQLNPIYDCTFAVDMPYEKIRKTSLEISVMDYDRFTSNDKIGQIIIGPRSGYNEVQHWNEMISNARTEIKKWHNLKKF